MTRRIHTALAVAAVAAVAGTAWYGGGIAPSARADDLDARLAAAELSIARQSDDIAATAGQRDTCQRAAAAWVRALDAYTDEDYVTALIELRGGESDMTDCLAYRSGGASL